MPEAKGTSGRIIDGILYVFGGYNGEVSTMIDSYNLQNKTWTFIGNMPVGISSHGTAVSGKYIWIVGSYDNIYSLALFNTDNYNFYQPTNDMIGRRHAGVILIGDYLYIYGGNQASTYASFQNTCEYANISQYITSIESCINGSVIYNTETGKFNFCEDGIWVEK